MLAWFAFLHDSQRHNDRRDPQHDDRAADFAAGLRRDGMVERLNDVKFEHLCEAMRLHSDGHTECEPAIIVCWDADRLDLGRVWINPDHTKFHTAYGRDPSTITAAVRMSDGRRR